MSRHHIVGICYALKWDGPDNQDFVDLQMEFIDGKKYLFYSVPFDTYDQLRCDMNSEGGGNKVFQEKIRGHFRYCRIESVEHDYIGGQYDQN